MGVEETEDKVILTHDTIKDTKVEILKFGATVFSWVHEGKEHLWLSEGAKLDGSKAVRGGIPLVFPVFGKQKSESHPTYKLPQHGFARNSHWEFLGQTTEKPLTVQFGLGPENVDEELYKLWNDGKYDFTLILSITLGDDGLKTQIEVENTGKEQFDFNWLFHTYHRVPDITDTLVTNFIEQECYDQLLAETYEEKSPAICFNEEFDRVYRRVDKDKVFQIVEFGKVLVNVERENLQDTVVWNPWIEKSGSMPDFLPKNGYLNMLCIEPGHVSDFASLKPNEKWKAAQNIKLGGEINVQTNIF